MTGMDAVTGKPLAGAAHLRQSMADVVLTPRGTRVMRRRYGSRIRDLVDAPASPATLALVYAATVEALAEWEPRVLVNRVIGRVAPGGLVLRIEGEHDGHPVLAEVTV